MVGNLKLVLVGGLLLVGSAFPSVAQQPAAEPDLAREMAGVNRSLEQMAAMLERLLENQKTDLVLKRIEMRERRIAPLETELRERHGELVTSQAELDRLEDLKEDWNDRLREAARTDENAAIELRVMQQQFEQAHGKQNSRHLALEERVRQLEDELAEGREVIQDLEALLLERIGD